MFPIYHFIFIVKKFHIGYSDDTLMCILSLNRRNSVMKPWRIWKRKMRIFFLLLLFPFFLTIFILLNSQSSLVNKNSSEIKRLQKSKGQEEYIDKRGIHVIVGHYIGNELPWNPTPNLTDGKYAFQYSGVANIPFCSSSAMIIQRTKRIGA